MRRSFTFLDCAESALLVDFGHELKADLSLNIKALGDALAKAELSGFKECVPALSSLTVFYDPLQLQRERLMAEILALSASTEAAAAAKGRIWEIPAVYGGEAGPDLVDVATLAGITPAEAVSLHANRLYQVYMLGFLPGFAYLGELPQPLRLPRRPTPRASVPAGSVAIAGDMTAIYPLESPGGWHLIGATPIALWDMARHEEPLLKPGDWVRFAEISGAEAEELRGRAAAGWRPVAVEAR